MGKLSTAFLVGYVADQTITLDLEPFLACATEDVPVVKLEEWGKRIIEALRKKGVYINVAKGDPSGRWSG